MDERIDNFFKDRNVVIATMHHKEKVIAPLLKEKLGMKGIVPTLFDTDMFGTFTRDIERKGDQLEAARYKVERGMDITGESIGIGSEGIFGPHPFIPFIPFNREIVLLIDKQNGFEIFGESVTTETNYSYKEVRNNEEAHSFCVDIGFPSHGVIVKKDKRTTNVQEIIKGIHTKEHLKEAVAYMLQQSKKGEICIETDMRALYNPTRMKNIERAMGTLIEKIHCFCPSCQYPGFEIIDRKKGLLCGGCYLPTEGIKAEIYGCKKCEHTEEKQYPRGMQYADPAHCSYCNP